MDEALDLRQNPKRVVVLMETEDGSMHAWEMSDIERLDWSIAGWNGVAELVIRGVFHRIRKTRDSMQLERRMQQLLDKQQE